MERRIAARHVCVVKRVAASYAPSSQERLPVPGPLGTVRDGFPSHGSSLTKACVTRGLDSLM